MAQQKKESSVSVGVRIRPSNEKEISADMPIYFNKSPDGLSVEELDEHGVVTKHWPYDYVFGNDSTNEEIFQSAATKLVDSALEGYNTVIFLYGQTASGKTFTLFGDTHTTGVVQQAIEYVYTKARASIDTEYVIKLNYAELYNEEIQDLLSPTPNKNLKIIEDPHVGPMIQNITEPVFTTAAEVKQMLEEGENRRHFGVTNMNAHSSRSHVIVRMLIESRRVQTRSAQPLRSSWGTKDRPNCISTLNLVDLAGSERANKAGTTGETLKEGSYINKSLLTLGTVIANLSEGKTSQHIPYRNSKLTRLLATALGGNAKTCMITCISPASGNLAESLNTLRFATRAKRIVNLVQRNEILDMKTLNTRLTTQAAEIEHLRQQLDLSKQLGYNPDEVDENGNVINKNESLRDKAVFAATKFRSVQFLLRYGAKIISSLRALGMSHLAKNCLLLMRQAVNGTRDAPSIIEEFSVIISTYLSKDRVLLEKIHDLELLNESETLLSSTDSVVMNSNEALFNAKLINSSTFNPEFSSLLLKTVNPSDDEDMFHMLERGGDEVREQLEIALFATEELRGGALKRQTQLKTEIAEGHTREKTCKKQIEDLQGTVIELRETIRALRNTETALNKQNEELKVKSRNEQQRHAEINKGLNDRLAQFELLSGDKDTSFAKKQAELLEKVNENDKLKLQVTQLTSDLQNSIQARKAFEDETLRIRNEERVQMERLRNNMHQMVVKGGEESKVVQQLNAELQKQVDDVQAQLEDLTSMKDALIYESVSLRGTIGLLRKEQKAKMDEIASIKEEHSNLTSRYRDARLEINRLTTNLNFTEEQIKQLYQRLEVQEREHETALSAHDEQFRGLKARLESKVHELQTDIEIKEAELESERGQVESKQEFAVKIEQSLNSEIARLEKKLAAQFKLSEELQTENAHHAMQVKHVHNKHFDEVRALKSKNHDLQSIIDSINNYIAKQEQDELFINTAEDVMMQPLALSDAYFMNDDNNSLNSYYDYNSPYSRRGSFTMSRKGSFLTGERQQETLYYKSFRRNSSQFSLNTANSNNTNTRDSVLGDDLDFTVVASDSEVEDDHIPHSHHHSDDLAAVSPLTPPYQSIPFKRKNTKSKNVVFSEPDAAYAYTSTPSTPTAAAGDRVLPAKAEEEYANYQQRFSQILYGLNMATLLMEHNIAEDKLLRQTMLTTNEHQAVKLQEGGYHHQQLIDQEEYLQASRDQLQQSLHFAETQLQQASKRLSSLEKEFEALNKNYHHAIGNEKVVVVRAEKAENMCKDLKLRLDKAKLDLQRQGQELIEMRLNNLRLQGKIEEGEEEQKSLSIRLEIAKREVDILGAERDEMMKRYLPQLVNRRPETG